MIIPASWPSLTVEANEAFNLTSFALSLLLVFRQVFYLGIWCEHTTEASHQQSSMHPIEQSLDLATGQHASRQL